MLGGANSDTQWYYPPDDGAIDAISAREAVTGIVKTHVTMYSQTVPARTPLISENVPVENMASQVAMITQVRPRIDTEWKARCTGWSADWRPEDSNVIDIH